MGLALGWAYSPLANVQPVRMDAALNEITMPTEIVAAIGEGALAYRERHSHWQMAEYSPRAGSIAIA
jgi:hypothetical protein